MLTGARVLTSAECLAIHKGKGTEKETARRGKGEQKETERREKEATGGGEAKEGGTKNIRERKREAERKEGRGKGTKGGRASKKVKSRCH